MSDDSRVPPGPPSSWPVNEMLIRGTFATHTPVERRLVIRNKIIGALILVSVIATRLYPKPLMVVITLFLLAASCASSMRRGPSSTNARRGGLTIRLRAVLNRSRRRRSRQASPRRANGRTMSIVSLRPRRHGLRHGVLRSASPSRSPWPT